MQKWTRGIAATALGALLLTSAACGGGDKKAAETSTSAATTTTAASSTTAAKKTGLTKEQIAEFQALLAKVGCSAGADDGIIGAKTKAATLAFQKAAGLEQTGYYNAKTIEALRADAAAGKKVCSTPASTTTTTSGGGGGIKPSGAQAPCTKTAINAALGSKVTVNEIGCNNGWAWAFATVEPDSPDGYDSTFVLVSKDGKWVDTDRSVCENKGSLPPDIYNPGCTTN